ncbi:MAG: sugar phosphate isomerase/epimerase family protein [Candidatus Binataceae bacterium]|jgi:sugar phosphate isomerase/epimerase
MPSSVRANLGRDDLIASYYTICGTMPFESSRFSFAERATAAARAGFSAIGLIIKDFLACRQGLSIAAMRSILDDNGLAVAEIELMGNWWNDGERGKRARFNEEQAYEAADALGGRHLQLTAIGEEGSQFPEVDVVADRFAALCERAARHGLLVALEFLPWTGIKDAKTAWAIAGRAGNNGGVLVDTWHHFRGANDPQQIRAIPAERITAIQFDDADPYPGGDLLADTMKRRLPGQGTFDLIGFIRLLDDMGVQAPISVEVISPEQAARTVTEAARLAHDTTRAVLAQARGSRR